MWTRAILHGDLDAFYASVEQRDDERLRGRPVLIGGMGRGGIVTTASYEARVYGARSGMPMFEARRLCPHALVVRPRLHHYAAISLQVMDLFERFSPHVEPIGLDEAFIDVTASQALFGEPARIAAELKALVREHTQLVLSVGVASSKYVAKVASDVGKPDGLCVVEPGTEAAFLAPLSLSKLWGVGPRTAKKLEAHGLRLIGELAQLEREELERLHGVVGGRLYELARGIDPREVRRREGAASLSAESTLRRDALGAEAIRPHLYRVVDRVAQRLRKHGLRAGGVRVKLKSARFVLHSRQGVLEASNHADTLFAKAWELVQSFDLREPVRLVGVAAFALESESAPQQQSLFDAAPQRQQARLDATLDAVQQRFGRQALLRATELG